MWINRLDVLMVHSIESGERINVSGERVCVVAVAVAVTVGFGINRRMKIRIRSEFCEYENERNK